VAPIERVKVLLQVQKGSPLKIAGTILREQGVLAFWRGNGVNVIRIIPNAAIKFSCNDSYKVMLAGPNADVSKLPVHLKMLAGSMSGVTMMLSTYPMDLARTRVTADMTQMGETRVFSGLFDCIIKTARAEGFFGLYKGLGPGLTSIIPYIGISFAMYDELKLRFSNREDDTSSVKFLKNLFIGAGSGVIAQSLTYPLDTVRRRMQMDGAMGAEPCYKNSMDCIQKIALNEGYHVFYRGLLVNAIKTTPGAAIQFTAYDALKALLTGV